MKKSNTRISLKVGTNKVKEDSLPKEKTLSDIEREIAVEEQGRVFLESYEKKGTISETLNLFRTKGYTEGQLKSILELGIVRNTITLYNARRLRNEGVSITLEDRMDELREVYVVLKDKAKENPLKYCKSYNEIAKTYNILCGLAGSKKEKEEEKKRSKKVIEKTPYVGIIDNQDIINEDV